ncbi:MAG: pyrimidine 5'-nucleotidase [Anaerolineae bacterium]|nr:pyrimidine 5'-nucleotidase [Anaerolineae bacterium]
MTNRNCITHVLFDLDETIYPTESGLMDLISERINEYMTQRLGMDPADVAATRQQYYQQYGTTGRGLYLNHGLDAEDYLEFVHDLPVEDMLRPDPGLDSMLEGLRANKSIFTNATVGHARRVLEVLGVARHFQQIIGIAELQYVPKPDLRAYQRALELLGARAEECLLVDDRERNLAPGRSLGMTTVLVGGSQTGNGADFVVDVVTEVGDVMEALCPKRGSRCEPGAKSVGRQPES